MPIINETHDTPDNIESVRSALLEVHLKNERLEMQLAAKNDELLIVCSKRDELSAANTELQERVTRESTEDIESLRPALKTQMVKAKRFWREKCEQLAHEDALDKKDLEIARLKAHVQL